MRHLKQICGVIIAGLISICCVDAADFRASDERVAFTGRWDQTNLESPRCAWQGSSFQLSFQGTSLGATISCDVAEYIRVIVNGDSVASRRIKLQPGRQQVVLAETLKVGQHQVEVVKETYTGSGFLTLHGLRTDGELIATRTRKRFRIQFYGDSNLAGHSLEHERNRSGAQYTGCHFTFAGIASRMLDAEYQNISRGGAGVLGRQNSVLSFYNRINYFDPEPVWDFRRFPADICVLNIGANDINRKSADELKQDFHKLLTSLRMAHPNAHIVVMNGYGWDRKEPANFTHEVVADFGDENMSCLKFPWLFNEWHGCEYDHAGMAVSLVNHLREINPAWKPVQSADVMDGFGRNGDVANGSFEQVAPFGGFGWRYRDGGAERVHAPDDSADGEWYLLLNEGTEVHQPNPAVSNQSYRIRMKFRAEHPGAIARVRIEYRDQKWRNEIDGAAREFRFHPADQWQDHELEVIAPEATGVRSRDVWQIIIRVSAEKGDVQCDQIRMSAVSGKD